MSRPNPFELEITPELIVRAYQAGIFPMSEDAQDENLFWVSPEQRGIIPLDGFRLSTSLRKAIRKSGFVTKVDTDFEAVIDACATVGADRDTTWINRTIRSVYGELFERGVAHTVEVWDGAELVGGLYGLAIGGAFFGESMFHRRTNASKIAMAHLVDRLNTGGYVLLDTQFLTDHLESLGGIEIPRELYEERLADALLLQGDWSAIDRN
ncbi:MULTISPECIES: leucyl/phenylalanyl-tRNA--protein transferase [Devosia]|jgi:leucyl/phenylalanyl-tRNA--protein transferase|uniref:Leucyl/phenylalanyl-tRNA--protein transferase n=1 Tax=Devosia litorisediminis TaxID=2829817 RepID=A0A942I523_9HYPH|nr:MULTISPECIES: leucyl/phenylalanyl-tRNA--protein transferase [Devosia]MBS3848196.1 leucyl/phenylalanyl-tRNA--protein transferase [Devosia litorisediminis]MCZ4345291.1 leucyl/phenylalanyl-tRNA--protein transferase [Devosia neptuniae]|tara:strand:+ start:43354 stop:43983 length:630 start_codon:yes stop_codon:yes gene_type:complete